MSSTLITGYLSEGIASARPATPSITSGAIAFYYATDTSVLSVWNGSSWGSVGGGYSPGTAPTVVQSQSQVTGNEGLTLGTAPISGNLLVAMSWNVPSPSTGSGWTELLQNGSGTDYGTIYYKVAGSSESATQNPLSANETPGCMVMWEINGQNATVATALLQSIAEAEQTSATLAFSPVMLPLAPNLLFLGGIGLVSSAGNFETVYNVTVDQAVKTGSTRQIVAGHATLATAPTAQIAASISASSSYKAMGLLISS